MKPNNKFKAVFNPLTREVAILFEGKLGTYVFKDLDEWFGFESNKESKFWLDLHLDYDECMQLSIYPRIDKVESYNEKYGATWTSDKLSKSKKIKIVYCDADYKVEVNKLQLEVTSYSDFSDSLFFN
jgi:hypothetical protein